MDVGWWLMVTYLLIGWRHNDVIGWRHKTTSDFKLLSYLLLTVFWLFWRLVHCWYSLGRPVTIGTPMVLSVFDDWYSVSFVKNSQKTVKNSQMYTAPLIAGTNRRPICCMIALRWRTVSHRSYIIDFTEDQQLTSVYIYILITYRNGTDQLQGIDQWGRRMNGHVIDIEKVELVKNHFEQLVVVTVSII